MQSVDDLLSTQSLALRPRDSQFRTYMDQVQKVVSDTSWSPIAARAEVSRTSRLDPAPAAPTRIVDKIAVPGMDIGDKIQHRPLPDPSHRDFLADMAMTSQQLEKANVERFLREYDHLKGHVQELDEKLQLLRKDKSFLTGRNEFLEKSNQDLSAKLALAENKITGLQRDKESLLKNAEIIHEKDRQHYLQSFQKVLKNLDSEKMKDLNSAIRKQVDSYESQIRDLKGSLHELTVEKTALKTEVEKSTERLNALQLEKATSQAETSQSYLEAQLLLSARTHEYDEMRENCSKAQAELDRLREEMSSLQERFALTTNEYKKTRSDLETEILMLRGSLREKNGQLEVYSRVSLQDRLAMQSVMRADSELLSKHRGYDDLSRKISELRVVVQGKNSADMNFGHQGAELGSVVKDQNREIMRLVTVVQTLKDQLRSEQETLRQVRRTRDELYEVLQNDPDAVLPNQEAEKFAPPRLVHSLESEQRLVQTRSMQSGVSLG